MWALPFFLLKRNRARPAQVDKRARAGIVIQSVAYCVGWQANFWDVTPRVLGSVLSGLFFAVGVWLAWTALRALGPQWRLDAGLNADHQLVRSAPYRTVRHPIYASNCLHVVAARA